MIKFIDWLFGLFGYVSKKSAEATLNNQLDTKDKLYLSMFEGKEHSYKMLQAQYQELEEKYQALLTRAEAMNLTTMEELNEENKKVHLENDQLHASLKEAEEYYKTVQKQVSEALHEDPVFGFNKSMAFPGSSSIDCRKDAKDTIIIASGRSILDDETTAKIQRLPSISMKYQIGLNHLLKYGLLNKLMENLINHGALQFTYGYNKDCTCIEMYYNIQCKRPDTILTVKEDGEG